ncbi:MAG TPA: GtrA family protein [Chthonomonadaceae bacterium]|nr:GtrA family protein [Chthonomonadaceae bacterium]
MTATAALMRHPSLRQFVKFCMIGFTSMLIDVGISSVLTYRFNWIWWVAKTLSFAIAATNGYIWNSLWTFRGMGSGRHHEQYTKFIAVNIVGWLLQLSLMKLVFLAFTGQLIQHQKPDQLHWYIATFVAVVCASVWNFIANKKWTFSGSRLEN